MPVWAAILTALGTGAFGAWLTTRNDRQERFRDRLIEAADDFTGASAEALIDTRDAIREVGERKDAVLMKESTERAWAARDKALRRSARVDLLFGSGSAASQSANSVLNELATLSALLQPPECDVAGADAAHIKAASELKAFQRSAFEDIRRAAPPSASMAETLRGWRRRRSLNP